MAAVGSSGDRVNTRFFGDLVRCETRLYNQFNDELRARHGITTSQYEFLRYLREHDRARVTDLAAEFAVGIGAVSKSMDRLEGRGLVTRLSNPDNRRSTFLAVTEQGRALVDESAATFERRLDEILATAAGPEAIAAAGAVLGALRSVLERDGLGTPAG